MASKSSTEKFKQEVYDLVGNEYTVLSEYINSGTPILINHNLCDDPPFEMRPNNFKNKGERCPYCAGLKLTHKKFLLKVKEKLSDEYTVLGKYINQLEPVKSIHNVCGEEADIIPKRLNSKGKYCPCKKCSKYTPGTTESFKQEVYDLVGDEYTVLGEYINKSKPILINHNLCDNKPFEMAPNNFKSQGQRCPYCFGNLKPTTEEFSKKIERITFGEYKVLGEYVNDSTEIEILHTTCNNSYKPTPHNFLAGKSRCPHCSKKKGYSEDEKEVLNFIKTFYNKEIIESDRKILNGKELDIYLPEDKIAIEFNGLYWHSEAGGKDKNYHLNKTLDCRLQGIRLIHIFGDEWIFKQDLVKSKLKYILGYANSTKLRASKCFITELDPSIKDQFLEENHIQGKDKSSIKLGLWYPINNEEDRLVAVMTFCKPRKALGQSKNSKYDYELSRFATDIEFQVYGAFDKLFKYFKENYEWSSIITYADRRWSIGGLYENTGFKLENISEPNYWWIRKNKEILKREYRYVYRKGNLKTKLENYDDSLTEVENMHNNDYIRIWDCGNYVYSYNKSNEQDF